MIKNPKFSLATLLLVAIGAALAVAQTNHSAGTGACYGTSTNPVMFTNIGATNPSAITAEKNPLPKLLDLGAGKCVPCKMMFPVLDQLKRDYAGALEVEFIDVWTNPDAGKQYAVEVIPTQIFYDATGKERFRHIGFFAKEDILAKWKELGVDLKTAK